MAITSALRGARQSHGDLAGTTAALMPGGGSAEKVSLVRVGFTVRWWTEGLRPVGSSRPVAASNHIGGDLTFDAHA